MRYDPDFRERRYSRYDRPMRGRSPRYESQYGQGRYGSEFGQGRYGSRYDRGLRPRRERPDYWWIGEHATQAGNSSLAYDDEYATFGRLTRPRYSPVGGMYQGMGGRYMRHTPRPLREPMRFSDWTRWF